MHGRLNSFQKTMLQWDEMHPYNAVHVARISGILRPEQLRFRLSAALERCGLTRLALDRSRNTFTYQGGPAACDLKILTADPDPGPALRAEVECQLNTPFVQAEGFSPFRFFAMPAKDSFFLGLVYFHPVADAESIVFLLRGLVAYYLGQGATEVPELDRYPDSRARLLRHPEVLARKLLALPGQVRQLKKSYRPRYREALDFSNGFSFFSLPPDHLRFLLAAGKDWDMTVNDLLLALLLKAVSPLARGRTQAARRNRISTGCIVNLRKDLGIDSARRFGLFLGSFTVTHAVPDDITLRELARDIRRQTLAIKRHRLYLATPMELGLGRFMLRFFSPRRQKQFYQKNYPLWGGVTNMNLNALWREPDDGGLLDYFRGVSTGPATPLVLSVTTIADRANVGLSYRSTVFSPADIDAVKSHFMQELEQLQAQEGA